MCWTIIIILLLVLILTVGASAFGFLGLGVASLSNEALKRKKWAAKLETMSLEELEKEALRISRDKRKMSPSVSRSNKHTPAYMELKRRQEILSKIIENHRNTAQE